MSATVICTRSLAPYVAVVWSALFSFLRVMVSSGAVAFSVLSLWPVELILQVGAAPASPAGEFVAHTAWPLLEPTVRVPSGVR